jgi:chorismate synthase
LTNAELGKAMLSINAVKGFEYGSGFVERKMKGSEHNDSQFDGTTKNESSGGIQVESAMVWTFFSVLLLNR